MVFFFSRKSRNFQHFSKNLQKSVLKSLIKCNVTPGGSVIKFNVSPGGSVIKCNVTPGGSVIKCNRPV